MVETALGRLCEEIERIPDSAACAARNRNSIDCAFSELRAMVRNGMRPVIKVGVGGRMNVEGSKSQVRLGKGS